MDGASVEIAREEAFAAVVSSRHMKNTCSVCYTFVPTGNLKRCADCDWIYYCHGNCRLQTRNHHYKKECSIYQKLQDKRPTGSLGEQARLAIRILLKSKDEILNRRSWFDRSWDSLNADEEQAEKTLKPPKDVVEEFKAMFIEAFEDAEVEPSLDLDEVINKVYLNGIRIFDRCDGKIAVGLGIFPGFHVNTSNCLSRNYLVFDGPLGMLRSLNRTAEFTPEIDIAFMPRLPFVLDRKKGVRLMFGYDCDCRLCNGPPPNEVNELLGKSSTSVCHINAHSLRVGDDYYCIVCNSKQEITVEQVEWAQKKVAEFLDNVYEDVTDSSLPEDVLESRVWKKMDDTRYVYLDVWKILSNVNFYMMDFITMNHELFSYYRRLGGNAIAPTATDHERSTHDLLRMTLWKFFELGQRDYTNALLDLANCAFWDIPTIRNVDIVKHSHFVAAFTYGTEHPVTKKRWEMFQAIEEAELNYYSDQFESEEESNNKKEKNKKMTKKRKKQKKRKN